MASSSKGRASSRKQSGAGKARVISTKRKDALPRTGSVAVGRRKAVVVPPIEALVEPPVTEVAVAAPAPAPKKKAHSLHQKKPTVGRKKTTRAAGRASAKVDEPVAVEVAQAVTAAPETEAVEAVAPALVAEGVPAEVVEAAAPSASAIEAAVVAALEPVADPIAVEAPVANTPAIESAFVTALESIADAVGAEAPVVNAPATEAATVTEPEVAETVAVEAAANAPAMESAFVTALESTADAIAAEAPVVNAPAIEAATVAAPERVVETVVAAEPPATAYEEFAVTALEASEAAALAAVETELEVEASAIVEELPFEGATAPSIAIGPPPIPDETRAPQLFRTTAERPAPAPPAPRQERRLLVPVIGRLLSTVFRLTGVSGKK